MDNAIYVGLSRQMTLRREFDILANNIANADTVGFKVESLMVNEQAQAPPSLPGSTPIKFVLDSGLARDFSQGSLKRTGAPLDLAIKGEGFFKISTAQGDRYTRDGRFQMDANGRLATQSGEAVQSADGGDIVLDPSHGAPMISEDGTVSQPTGAGASSVVGKVGLVRFSSLSALSKTGDGLYRNDTNLQPDPATDAKVEQGMLETSNVQSIAQITRLIEVSRAYEMVSKLVDLTGDLTQQSVQRLGKVQ